MSKILQLFSALMASALIAACGGGGVDLGTLPKLSSVTVAGVAVSTTTGPINIKVGQTVMVTLAEGRVLKDNVFSATSTLNGSATPTVLDGLVTTDTTWRATINSAAGSVMTLVVKEDSTKTVIANLVFNIQSP
jgi:hypothetical protein